MPESHLLYLDRRFGGKARSKPQRRAAPYWKRHHKATVIEAVRVMADLSQVNRKAERRPLRTNSKKAIYSNTEAPFVVYQPYTLDGWRHNHPSALSRMLLNLATSHFRGAKHAHPRNQLINTLPVQLIDPPLGFNTHLNQPRFAQSFQMLGHCWGRYLEQPSDFSRRKRALRQSFHDSSARRIGNGRKAVHSVILLK